ncbi:MAG: peptidoglycan DD-metalloendopeptidase family protein [Aggregatilineales bacterium]
MSMSPPAVPKPPTAGPGRTAIVNTTLAYVNIRNGPGTNYRDIGDIYNKSLVVYYPGSRADNGWVWVEQGALAGWVSTAVARFEEVVVPGPPPNPTPYDGKVAVWHWRGDIVPEATIDELARNLRQAVPHVGAVFVKTSDYTPRSGARWQGFWDTKRALAIDGPASIDRWVETLAKYGLDFHAWCVPRGLDERAETDLIIQACQRPGVKSMILDVEPYDGFWSAGREGIRPFMLRIRRELPGRFHIGLAVDPRPQHYRAIFPEEWFPFVQSVHPMAYWATFRRSPEAVLAEVYQVWGGYGRTIIPILQADAQPVDINTAHVLATQRHGAPGLSWWRLGVIGAAQWAVINQPIAPGAQPPGPGQPGSGYGEEIVIRPDEAGFAKGSYTGQPEFQSFQGTWGWTAYYTATARQFSRVWAQWSPRLPASGRYEIAVFAPARHASTRNARYKIHGVAGSTGEIVVSVDQSRYANQWVSLGVYNIDRSTVNGGSVFLNDLTFEDGLQIAFDAIRWRQIVEGGAVPRADGYDSPVGTLAERRSNRVWPGEWYDASPFAQLYFIGTPSEAYHTGADLNLPRDADRFAPVYAVASGVVTFASRLPVWGNVIVIRHDPLVSNGRVMYSRSAHVDTVLVRVGQRVRRGDQIATIGNAFGRWAYHLHFDLSPTAILETQPQHWPGRDLSSVLMNYVDPRLFIEQNRP